MLARCSPPCACTRPIAATDRTSSIKEPHLRPAVSSTSCSTSARAHSSSPAILGLIAARPKTDQRLLVSPSASTASRAGRVSSPSTLETRRPRARRRGRRRPHASSGSSLEGGRASRRGSSSKTAETYPGRRGRQQLRRPADLPRRCSAMRSQPRHKEARPHRQEVRPRLLGPGALPRASTSQYEHLAHHNFLFSRDSATPSSTTSTARGIPARDPTLYIAAPSKNRPRPSANVRWSPGRSALRARSTPPTPATRAPSTRIWDVPRRRPRAVPPRGDRQDEAPWACPTSKSGSWSNARSHAQRHRADVQRRGRRDLRPGQRTASSRGGFKPRNRSTSRGRVCTSPAAAPTPAPVCPWSSCRASPPHTRCSKTSA